MPHGKYETRTRTRAEVDVALEWAANEGWNPGLHDADCFFRADRSGSFIGLLAGEPIGSISAVAYGDTYGFVGLDGVVEQRYNYKKSGFKLAYRNIRYQWTAAPSIFKPMDVVQTSEVSKAWLAEFDKGLFGVERPELLECWTSTPPTRGREIVQDERLVGYGIIRKCRTGFKVGPLFADARELADRLFRSLTADPGEGMPVFPDVPEVNPLAVGLAQEYGMTKVFEIARMCTGDPPNIPPDRWFGVTTFELD